MALQCSLRKLLKNKILRETNYFTRHCQLRIRKLTQNPVKFRKWTGLPKNTKRICLSWWDLLFQLNITSLDLIN